MDGRVLLVLAAAAGVLLTTRSANAAPVTWGQGQGMTGGGSVPLLKGYTNRLAPSISGFATPVYSGGAVPFTQSDNMFSLAGGMIKSGVIGNIVNQGLNAAGSALSGIVASATYSPSSSQLEALDAAAVDATAKGTAAASFTASSSQLEALDAAAVDAAASSEAPSFFAAFAAFFGF